jgi:23S rRNA pseudouridine2457 synthase
MMMAPVNSRNPRRTALILFNKPCGVICQFSPSEGKPTLKQFIAQPGFYPAGRLDTDSEGLVLLTSDGALQHRIADPRHKMAKTYWVQVEGQAMEQTLAPLRKGIELGDFRALPAAVRIAAEPAWLWPRQPPIRVRQHIPTSWLELTLREGKNRQVRRMTAAVGLPTLRLIRYSIGPWSLAGLPPGNHKLLILND